MYVHTHARVQCMVWGRYVGVSCDIVSCFFLLTNLLEYLRVGSFSFSGVVGDPTQAGKNKTHVTFSHGKKKKKKTQKLNRKLGVFVVPVTDY